MRCDLESTLLQSRRDNLAIRRFLPPGMAVGLPLATGGAGWRCLAGALYFEARGETVKGFFAVAEVILNRVDSAHFHPRAAFPK